MFSSSSLRGYLTPKITGKFRVETVECLLACYQLILLGGGGRRAFGGTHG